MPIGRGSVADPKRLRQRFRTMSESSPPGRDIRTALLMLQRLLAEADRSFANGDVHAAEAALAWVGSVFDIYWRDQREATRELATETALGAARRAALLNLGRFLSDIDALLATGDLQGVKVSLEKAKDAADTSRALDESNHQS